MRLGKLCTFELSYDADVRVKAPGYELVSAYDSDEGIAYGEGRGRASGGIEGSVVFSCIAEGLIGDDGMRIDVYHGVNDLAG